MVLTSSDSLKHKLARLNRQGCLLKIRRFTDDKLDKKETVLTHQMPSSTTYRQAIIYSSSTKTCLISFREENLCARAPIGQMYHSQLRLH